MADRTHLIFFTSAGAENAGPEESKGSPNHTEMNHTEMSDIYPIVSEQDPYTALPDPRDGASPEESRFDGYDANPNYKYTADYNKKYTFDIEKCLNHRMKLKAGEEYEVVEVDDDEKE